MEKPQKAVAIKYEKDRDNAPRLIAKGRAEIAEKIIAIAEEHHVPVYEDGDLASLLEALELDMEIPPELYCAVAEVLAFIYNLNKKF